MKINDKEKSNAMFDTATEILVADKSTGVKPGELFVVDEHNEHYLAVQAKGTMNLGTLTGVLGGVGGCLFIVHGLIETKVGYLDSAYMLIIAGILLFLLPFLWETLRPLPLPILFNRRTREVYFEHNGELFHAPWDGITAVAKELQPVGAKVNNLQSTSLEARAFKFGKPETTSMISLCAPIGNSMAMQKAFWEYIRAYMNNGPYFDKHGIHSESDAFVKSQLRARFMMSNTFKRTLARIKQAKIDTGGRNYLGGDDVGMLVLSPMFYLPGKIHELTYSVAKRHFRNSWPRIVTERLKPNGPTTRLVDLECENEGKL
ncbi:DUF6708 domain-containing protein [Pseudomonas sp. H9]|uniref:DUF6708 domain-containing protein n=1 Tax=Pseudomonas sp. H9 TaxID=483968 RepID=UPI0010581BB8|nr:DUF6708 domain-containing protein [Pseudomonas sp. H9]TDF83908.1 hypothetical protein E1573_09165 [Pseudomonas sp. H9]